MLAISNLLTKKREEMQLFRRTQQFYEEINNVKSLLRGKSLQKNSNGFFNVLKLKVSQNKHDRPKNRGWRDGSKCLPLLQLIQVQFPAPKWWLRNIYNSSSWGSSALLRPHRALHTGGVHTLYIHTCMQTNPYAQKINIFKCLNYYIVTYFCLISV